MSSKTTFLALVRPPGQTFAQAISTRRAAIDVALAQTQHVEYCAALREAGAEVIELPPDERYPDSCFMQDPAMVIAGQGIVCRLAVASRQGEEEDVARALAERAIPLARIQSPGTLEGGDVMRLPTRVLVGRTARSNDDGIDQLTGILGRLGLPVLGIPVPGYLHLLTAATYLGQNLLLAVADFADHPAFAGLEIISVAPEDTYAANALALDETVILPAGHPRVAGPLKARGLRVLEVPTGEFAKADGGVTCLSLVVGGAGTRE